MSIYIYTPVANQNASSQAHRSRGLAGVPCSVADCNTYGIRFAHVPYADEYYHNMDLAIIAKSRGESIHTNSDTTVSLNALPDFDLPLPTTMFVTIKSPLDKDTIENNHLRPMKFATQSAYVFSANSTITEISTFVRTRTLEVNQSVKAPSGYASVYGLRSFITLRKFVYAAASIASIPIMRDSKYETKYADGLVQIETVEISAQEAKRLKEYEVVTKDVERESGDEEDMDSAETKYTIDQFGIQVTPKCHVTPAGTVNTMPDLPGILFPYFHGMCNADPQVVTSFVSTYLPRLFSRNKKDLAQALALFLGNVRTALATVQGAILCHMIRGLLDAFKVHARVFYIISNNQYKGYCLFGEGFAFVTHGALVGPVRSEELRRLVGELQGHDIALERLAQLLSEIAVDDDELDGGETVEVTVQSLSSSAMVMEQVKMRQENATEEEAHRISFLCNDIEFPGELYKEFSVRALLEVFEFFSEDANVDRDLFPGSKRYIKDGTIYRSGRLMRLLSVFGPNYPDLYHVGGVKYTFHQSDENDPALKTFEEKYKEAGVEKSRQVPPFKALYIRRVPHAEAAVHWKSIEESGYILVPKKEISRKDAANYTTVQGELKLELWRKLRVFYKAKEASGLVAEEIGPVGKKIVAEGELDDDLYAW